MISAARSLVDQPACNSGHKEAIVNLELDGMLKLLAFLGKHIVQPFCLCDGAREAVQDEASAAFSSNP